MTQPAERALWEEHRDRIVAELFAEHPGTRSSRWWEFSAPEPWGNGALAHVDFEADPNDESRRAIVGRLTREEARRIATATLASSVGCEA